jgi:hypothetical protein
LTFDDWADFSFQAPRDFADSKETRITCFAAILLSNVIDRLIAAGAFDSLHKSVPFYCGVGFHEGVQRVIRMINFHKGT